MQQICNRIECHKVNNDIHVGFLRRQIMFSHTEVEEIRVKKSGIGSIASNLRLSALIHHITCVSCVMFCR